MTIETRSKAVILGAGIAGLSAAFRLREAGWDVKILERSGKPGGRMKTVSLGAFTIDVGAGILPASYKSVLRLIRDAGLDRLIEPVGGKIAIPRDGTLHYLAMDRLMLSLMTTKLLPWRSKLNMARLGLDTWRTRKTLGYDTIARTTLFDMTTAAEYGRRYLDPDLMDYMVEPTLRTLFLNSAEETSIVEFFWSMTNLSSPSSFCLRGGMNRLAIELAERLPVTYGAVVDRVDHGPSGAVVTWTDQAGMPHEEEATVCIVAADANVVRSVCGHWLTQRQQAFLANLPYSTSVNLHFGLKRDPGVEALIIQIPAPGDPALAALVMDHLKGSGRAPPGKGLVSAYFIDAWSRKMLPKSDEAIFEDALPRIERVIPGFGSMIEVRHVERWDRAATILEVGQCGHLAEFEADLKPDSAVILASDLFSLSSVNTCTVQGERAAVQAQSLAAGRH